LFKQELRPNFEYFLSCGIEGEVEGERYNRSMVDDMEDSFLTTQSWAKVNKRIKNKKIDGFVKSPSAALRCILSHCSVQVSTLHSLGFARLASGAFYCAVRFLTFYDFIKNWIQLRGGKYNKKGKSLFSLAALSCL